MCPAAVIYVDGDACPVKDEIFRVAARHGVKSIVVANSYIRLPRDPLIEAVVVPAGLDAADDWIAARADRSAVVITADVPLAARAVKAGATVLAPNGRAFTAEAIGMALATRNLMEDLRGAGVATAGPPPFSHKDRSKFLSALHIALTRLLRG